MRGKAAFGITGAMVGGVVIGGGAGAASDVVATGGGGNAVVGVAHAPKVAAGEDIGIADGADIIDGGVPLKLIPGGADIIDGLGIAIGGGATAGPPDIILENAMGSIPGGIPIPLIFAAAIISAAVGSTVPVM